MIKNYVLLGAAGTLMFMASCKKDLEKTSSQKQEDHFNCTFLDTTSEGTFKTDAAIRKNVLWTPGQTIRIKFIGGTTFQQNKVKEYAAQWTKEANLKFEFFSTVPTLPNPFFRSDIKITFDPNDGDWSVLGTQCKDIAQTKGSMNFSWTATTSETRIRRVVLHEFGHALGLIHEHMSPSANISWDKPKAYAYFGASPSNWDKAKVDRVVLNKETASTTNYTAYDNSSIMLYSFPDSLTTNGYSAPYNTELSYNDKKYIGRNYPFPTDTWQQLFTNASDVGVGTKGTVWALSKTPTNGGYTIYKYNGSSFKLIPGGAIAIDVDGEGNPWVVNSYGNIFRGTPQGVWTRIQGSAKDIGVGANGIVYIIGTDPKYGGYNIARYNGTGWTTISGAATRISVDNQGNPWVVNSYGNVFRLTNGTFINVGGPATDIGCGADGSTFITTKTSVNGNYTIKKFTENGWIDFNGGAIKLDVSDAGGPYAVTTSGSLYRYNN
ncbi:MAG: matrixin family metalloprotease [Bacteroidetes bacterium]|nr:matrixin family metalloprotease [Bacteroidota bacterium]